MDIQTALGSYLSEQASWRDAKAYEYPDDERNRRCAEGLRLLGEHVAALPADDPRLVQLDALDWEADTGFFMPGEEGARAASRFRFDNADEPPDSFLSRFTEDCIVDATCTDVESAPWDAD